MADNTLKKLSELEDENPTKPFGPYEEEAIISLAIDHPEFFLIAGRFLKPQMFQRIECQYIIGHILNLYEKYEIVPTRELLRETIENTLTIDEPYENITRIINRKSNPREVPLVKDTLLKWAKNRAYGLLYNQEAIEAYHLGNYEYIEKIVNEANRIADIGASGFWFLENYQILFEPSIIDHRTTGFPRLDKILNNGGPSPKEVCCFLAGTNVGKCHTLQSKIIEEKLSRIYEIELENGTILKLAGFREIQTLRGIVKVCDLTEDDDIEEMQSDTSWDLEL